MWGKVSESPASYSFGRLLGYGALFLVGALAGLLLVPDQEAFATGYVPVLVAGQEVERAQDAEAVAVTAATRFVAERFAIAADAERVELPRSALGTRVDVERLAALIEQARNPRSALRRVHRQVGKAGPIKLPLPVETDPWRIRPAVVRLKDAFEQSARPGNNGKAKRSPHALLLDVHGTIDAVEAALTAGRSSARARLVRLPGAAKDAVREEIDVSEVVGVFETRFDPDRTSRQSLFSLRSTAEAIDGRVLREGEVFDFNRVAIRRSRPNRKTGRDTDAGGAPDPAISQAAGTLHGAALFSGLPILERHPHKHTPEQIKLGLDAAAGREGLNLRFRNDLPFPIVVGMTVERGTVRAELRGARRSRTVTLERSVVSAIPFKRRFREDHRLPQGIRILSRRGVPGFIVKSVKTVKHGSGAAGRERRESVRDVYRPVTERWLVGTGPLDIPVERLPENDTRPEFLQDEYLVATQGPGIRGFDVRRVPGITGAHGWTSRDGFAKN